VDLNRLASALVKTLRGPRLSQQQLSQRLGYDTNVVYLWERGRRHPAASAFLGLAQLRRVPVLAGLRDFLGTSTLRGPSRGAARFDARHVSALLAHCAARRSASELAELTGFDRNTIARWLGGATEPRLPDLLRFVGVTTLRLLDFVAVFADPAQLEATREAYAQLRAQRELAYASPWSHAVLRALELDGYPSAAGNRQTWLAARLGISAEQVTRDLHALERAGQVQRDAGVYRPSQVLSVDTRSDFDHNLRLKAFWAEVASERLARHSREGSNLFSYNLFAISEADLQRIRRLHVEYYERVRQLVAQARSAERVVLLNLQLVALDEG
jgi:transcriptional regulator with XRE-family HTH domain/DNA-binding Lrp family transcriptional regulator